MPKINRKLTETEIRNAKAHGTYRPSIRINGKMYYLGSCKDKMLAAKIRDIFVIKFYGGFAKLNYELSTSEQNTLWEYFFSKNQTAKVLEVL